MRLHCLVNLHLILSINPFLYITSLVFPLFLTFLLGSGYEQGIAVLQLSGIWDRDKYKKPV